MRTSFALLVLHAALMLGVAPTASGQETQRPPGIPTTDASARESSPPTAAETLAERRALVARPDYQPYRQAMIEITLVQEHFRLANEEDADLMAINAPLQKLVETYPLGIDGHLVLAGFIEHVAKNVEGQPPDADLLRIATQRRAYAQAIIDGILSTGDGRSTATAYQVIHPGEEYSVLRHLGLEPVDQSMILGEPGKSGNPGTPSTPPAAYDLIRAKTRDGKTLSVYFDISSFFGKQLPRGSAVDASTATADTAEVQADAAEAAALDAAANAADAASAAMTPAKGSRASSPDKTPDGGR